jgi:hypothetical protein
MNKNVGWIAAVVVISILLILSMVFGSAGLNNTAAPAETPSLAATEQVNTPLPTSTPDPCSQENIPAQVGLVNSLTREFMDTDQVLATTLLRDTSVPLVQDLQRIRRNAEDQVVPACLTDFKKAQIVYMNARLDIYGNALAFLNNYGPSGERQAALNQLLEPFNVKSAIAAHQYESEYARLMGLPMPTPLAIVTITPKP